jgi:eukaryotic-like serine/threonine-protein kinase
MPSSNSNRWRDAEAVFHRAVELHERDRTNYIRTACEGDQELSKEVYSMLRSYENSDSFLEDTVFLGGFQILQAQHEQLAGKRLGRYEIIKLIGTGGMGEVFLAHDVLLDRRVALKLLPELLTDDASRVRRFEQEAHTASTISHPNIAHIYEIGVEGNYHFTSMEFVEGLTLRQVLNQRRLSVAEALDKAVQVCSALVAAHSSGVIHRDIKPENIMIRPDGYVKVLDFGLAKRDRFVESRNPRQTQVATMVLTEPGLIVGSPAYMSPEQARGMDVDARTDIWSLGVVLYEMLCGWTPFQGATNMDFMCEKESMFCHEDRTLQRTRTHKKSNLMLDHFVCRNLCQS